VTLLSLAVIAFLARSSPRGGAVVLISGLAVAACGGLMLSFLGRFIGVYMLTLDAALLVVGGGLQLKASPAS